MTANTIRASLTDTALPRLETHMLWQHVLDCPRAWLAAHDTDPLPARAVARFQTLRARRLQGEPMAYLLGHREFMGHDFLVSPAVLIPRPETEGLVEEALRAAQRIRQSRDAQPRADQAQADQTQADQLNASRRNACKTIRALDLGTGSGAIAISLALADANLRVTATDISSKALDVARQNAHRLNAAIEWRQGRWYDALSRDDQYALIVSNPPYVARHDAHLRQGDLRFEPRQALTDGADGFSSLRAIITGAARHLAAGGECWLEHGWDQAAGVRNALSAAGFDAVRSVKDLAGVERISGGVLHRPLKNPYPSMAGNPL